VKIMKKILLFGCGMVLLVAAGCLTNPAGTGTAQSPMAATTSIQTVPSITAESNPVFPMNTTVVLGTKENPFTASIDSFEIDSPTQPGKQTVTVYIAVKNTGTEPVQMVWFSKLTDFNGNMYGGIGISHGGTGARSGLILPNMTEAARDYIVVPAAGFPQLSKGAVLDVYFMIKKSDTETVSLKPDYHTRWAVDPGVIA
jgi:hypothetical protein